MHVRVRLLGKPEVIVVVESKLTKIEQFRKAIKEKFDVASSLQRLLYGGKLLENGYTFHDYNIKLNDVIQLMIRSQPLEESKSIKLEDNATKVSLKTDKNITYQDAKSKYFVVGDLVDMRDREQGAWLEGKIERIVYDPSYTIPSPVETSENKDNKTDEIDKKQVTDNEKSPKNNGIARFFTKIPKSPQTNKKEKSQLTKCDDEESNVLYKVHLEADADEPENQFYCKLKEIRPRARKVLNVENLQLGQTVMINHNTEDLLEKGYWYDFKIDEIKKIRTNYELIGTLYLGPEAIPQDFTKIKVHDKIFSIEEIVPLAERSEEYNKLMVTPTEKRSAPLNCLTCRDDDEAPCKECGCFLCLGKQFPEKIILCDECNNGYHMDCLTPPLTALPDDDWYCDICKRDPNDVVAPGAAKQTKKTTVSKTTRDWGRGMACVGKTKTCAMPANHFGPIPGIEVGMCWRFRIQVSETGVHRPPVSGIHGRDVEGAYSIVLSGGYEDDYDNGDEFTYTGSGGRDLSGNKRTAEQSCDQLLTRENKALARNCAVKQIKEEGGDAGENWRDGKPVRVVRSYKMLKHFPQYAPKEGIRYDGIYKVVKYYPEKGKSGFRVWKYLLRRDDPSLAPWEKGAKQHSIVYPDGYLEAEAEKKALKEKGAKVKKSSKKRALRETNHSSDSEQDESISDNKSPPQKKRKTKSAANGSPTKKGAKNIDESPKIKTPSIFANASKNNKSKSVEAKENTNLIENMISKDELDAIRADSLNFKLWNECLEVCKTGGKKEFVEHLTQMFLCIICQDLPANPITTSCFHNFCMGCMKNAFKSTGTKSCPYCRNNLSKEELDINEGLKRALQTIMPGYDAGRK